MCSGVQAAIPDGDDEVRVADGQGAREVDGVRTSQRLRAGQLPGVLLDGGGELDRARGRPEAIPGLLGRVKIMICDIMIAGSCG